MIGRIKLFVSLLMLNIPSSIQQLLDQNVVQVAPNTFQVLQDNTGTAFEEVIPSNTIQVIDVKDDHHQVISNVQNIAISHETDNLHNDTTLHNVSIIHEDNNTIVVETNGTVHVPKTLYSQQNDTNLKADNVSVTSQNVSYTQSTAQQNVTTTKRDLSSINTVQNNSSNNDTNNNGLNSLIGRRVGDNSGLINVTFTENNANFSNNHVLSNTNDSGSNPVNADISIKKTNYSEVGNLDTVNGTVVYSLNNVTIHNNTGLLDHPIHEVALLNETQDNDSINENPSSNGTIEDSDISFRSDFPRKKHYVVRIETDNQNKEKDEKPKERGLQTNDSNSNLDNLFVILNTGNISGLQANLPLQSNNSKFNSIKTTNTNSRLLSSLINTTLNNLAGNILDQNINDTKTKNVFVILNSGTISNFYYNSQNDEENNLKNNNFETRRLKKDPRKGNFSIDNNNRIIDIKFRRKGDLDADNNENTNSNEENTSLENESLNTTIPVIITINEEKNGDQIKENSNSNLNNKNNFDLGKALFSVEPINPNLDLTNINVLDGAIDILNRFKRSLKKHERKNRIHKDEEKNNEKYRPKSLDKKDLINSLDISKERKISLEIAKLIDELKFNFSLNNRDCPLSVLFKLALKQLYGILSESDNLLLKILLKYLSYIMEGKDKVINLVTHELIHLPLPIKIRLQLLQGDPTKLIKEILEYINSILCQ